MSDDQRAHHSGRSWAEGTELLEDLQDVDVDVWGEEQTLQRADVLEHQLVMLKPPLLLSLLFIQG